MKITMGLLYKPEHVQAPLMFYKKKKKRRGIIPYRKEWSLSRSSFTTYLGISAREPAEGRAVHTCALQLTKSFSVGRTLRSFICLTLNTRGFLLHFWSSQIHFREWVVLCVGSEDAWVALLLWFCR